jgi:hypothetical protein
MKMVKRIFKRIFIRIYLGNVIIGSVEGSRIAGKSLRNNKLAKVEVELIHLNSFFLLY